MVRPSLTRIYPRVYPMSPSHPQAVAPNKQRDQHPTIPWNRKSRISPVVAPPTKHSEKVQHPSHYHPLMVEAATRHAIKLTEG